MPIFDTILVFSLVCFIFYGFLFGLIRTFGSLAGLVIGVLYANAIYLTVFSWIDEIFFGYSNIGKFVVFLVIFSIVNRLVCLGFSLLDKAFNIISILPFLKTINRLSGAMLGFLMGIVAIGLTLFILSMFFGGWFDKISAGSELTPFLLKSAQLTVGFLPFVFTKASGWIKAWSSNWGG